MEAKELRIGNYYRRMYGHGYEDIVKATIEDIIEINTKPWSEHVWFDGIELTNEWIIKFGFDIKLEYLNDSASTEDKIIIHEKDGYYLLIGSYWGGEEYVETTKKIKYVHQLQNLYFALTNEELTYGK